MKIGLLLRCAMFATADPVVSAHAGDLTLTLDNQSGAAVHEFYASPVNVGDWKQNILGEPVLEAGESVLVVIPGGQSVCNYDLRIVFSEGEELDAADVNLCETDRYTVSDPGE